MKIRVLAVLTILAGFCGTAVYAQLPERVTFRPATFGHSTYSGYNNTSVGSSDKITYASTQYTQRGYRGQAVSRAYRLEPSKIVGYSPYSYGVKGNRHVRSGRYYTPIVMDDCLCGSGGLIESPQLAPTPQQMPPVKVETNILPEPVKQPPVVKPEVPAVKEPLIIAPPAPVVEPKVEIEEPAVTTPVEPPATSDDEDPFGLSESFPVDEPKVEAPRVDTAQLPAIDEPETEEAVEDEEDPFGDSVPALTTDTEEPAESVEEEEDPFGENVPAPVVPDATEEDENVPSFDFGATPALDEEESDPFGADLTDEPAPVDLDLDSDTENDPFADEAEEEDAAPADDSDDFDPFG